MRASLVFAAVLAMASCFTTDQKARVCRSLARYPLACSPEMIEVRVFHPDKLTPGAGDSICLLSHANQSVVCTSRAGVWECSVPFSSK